jgi:hypothetical protein
MTSLDGTGPPHGLEHHKIFQVPQEGSRRGDGHRKLALLVRYRLTRIAGWHRHLQLAANLSHYLPLI